MDTFMVVFIVVAIIAIVGGIILLGGRGDAKRKLKEKIEAHKKK